MDHRRPPWTRSLIRTFTRSRARLRKALHTTVERVRTRVAARPGGRSRGGEGLGHRRPSMGHPFPTAGKFSLLVLLTGAGATTFVVASSAFYLSCGFAGCPDVRSLEAWQPGGAPTLLDRSGEPFADLAPYERAIVRLEDLPPYLPAAFLAVEDRRFHRHDGVDWIRVVGAALANLRTGRLAQGSSTISMQLARNVFPERISGSERTFRRKFREVRVARRIEDRFTKDEILEMYLNHIYFGGGAYGIEAAARLYFDRPAAELSLAEAATLAALPKAPANYDPRRRPERSRERRDLVLSLMVEAEVVSEAEAAVARATELSVAEGTRPGGTFAGYFVDRVRDLLEDHFGADLYAGPLRIHTTLDRVAQAAAEEEMEAHLHAIDRAVGPGEAPIQGAVVLLDARTGAVRALLGGRPSDPSRYDRATLARRQVGSAFKPFVYAAALAEGIPLSRVLHDVPVEMRLSGNDVWIPANYDARFEGEVSLREALVRSRNVPTVRLASEVGIPDIADFARNAGLDAPMDETPALALGTVATSPLRLASAYTPFASLGYGVEPHFVVRVEDADGRVLWEPPLPAPVPTVDPRIAYLVTDVLRGVVDRGTGTAVRGAGYTGVAAGKTGTTNDATDAWFVGFTPELVGTVWIGYDRPASLGRSATGGGLAAPLWGRILRQVAASHGPSADWPRPSGIIERTVDPASGLLLEEGCRVRGAAPYAELFLAEHLPQATCPSRGTLARLWDGIRGTASRILPLRRADPNR